MQSNLSCAIAASNCHKNHQALKNQNIVRPIENVHCAVWEALMGEIAYDGISKMQVMFGVVSEGLRPLFPPNTPKWYSQIATACWREGPKQR